MSVVSQLKNKSYYNITVITIQGVVTIAILMIGFGMMGNYGYWGMEACSLDSFFGL